MSELCRVDATLDESGGPSRVGRDLALPDPSKAHTTPHDATRQLVHVQCQSDRSRSCLKEDASRSRSVNMAEGSRRDAAGVW